LADAIVRSQLALLSWSDGARNVQQRIAFLHTHEATWPDLRDDALITSLEEWLIPWLGGASTAAELGKVDIRALLLRRLSHRQRAELDRLAPEHFVAPTGSRLRIDYSMASAPSVAVRLQELFGLAEHPTVLGGRVAVTLHLLSPAHRPVQVTRDLHGFWLGSYHEVRRELRGRYPKHEWPEDPASATPTRRAKPRNR
jgi:ATP-dependent helicase HrpB